MVLGRPERDNIAMLEQISVVQGPMIGARKNHVREAWSQNQTGV